MGRWAVQLKLPLDFEPKHPGESTRQWVCAALASGNAVVEGVWRHPYRLICSGCAEEISPGGLHVRVQFRADQIGVASATWVFCTRCGREMGVTW